MPELPEVETIKRQLAEVLVGQKIVDVEVRNSKSFFGDKELIIGKRIAGVSRRAKMLVIEMGDWRLVTHLKMTGQLVYQGQKKRIVGGHPTADWIAKLPNNHTRVILKLEKGTLFFNDQRIFGWMKLVEQNNLEKEFKNYGPDITEVSEEHFWKAVQKSRRAIKLVVMDQKDMAGVGNIYANDALWCSGISPQRSARDLAREESDRLLECLKQVINEGIKYGGATASDDKFVHTSGMGGKYQEHFRVYEQTGKKCKTCNSVIKKMTLGGRGTYYCPVCQG